jgi:hypothetical protein
MKNDDEQVGRILTRREALALLGSGSLNEQSERSGTSIGILACRGWRGR